MKRASILLVGLSLLAPVVPAPALGALAAQAEQFTLGVLRRDGLVLPFAAYAGRRWSTPWPADYGSQELPIGLDDVPERWWGRAGRPGSLKLWSDGVDKGPVAITRPIAVPIMCSTRMALRSDYKPVEPVPAPIVQPFPKDGLVVSGGHTIRAIPAVPRTSSEWTAAPVVIENAFSRAEDTAAGMFTDWRHPRTAGERRATPIEIEALYRAPMDEEGWAAYYVEAVRRYAPAPEDEGCGLVTFASGWIRVGPNAKANADLTARVTYCDRRRNTFMLPLGLVTADNRTYWIYQVSGYDREWYVVAHPTPARIELHVDYAAGTCPVRS